MKLFAIITDYDDNKPSELAKASVNAYLHENFNRELVDKYCSYYNKYVKYYHSQKKSIRYENRGSGIQIINQEYLTEICAEIDNQFDLETRFMIVVQLLNFIQKDGGADPEDIAIVNLVAKNLNINQKEYEDLRSFFLLSIREVRDKSNLFVVNGNKEYHLKNIKHLYRENQRDELEIIRIQSINTLIVKYHGPRNMYLNGHRLQQRKLYVFPQGGILRTSRIIPIYYSSIMSRFIQEKGKPKIVFNAENIEYRFGRKHYGLHPTSFQERSGDLVGILGGSGVGKTTLLNVLNGKLKPQSGKIVINGYDLHDPKNKEILEGTIGYVPQDDLLLEELTVYKNLEFNARLCFADFPDEEIHEIVEQVLLDFDLVEARDLVVGNPLKKILSGGQRKRLNIALELMREPSILFVDEPTSGLSSSDSEKVMYLLKKQCLKGKLVFANIHQPSSDIYKLFDRMIVMDKGGRIVFFGNPMEAISYFKEEAQYINPDKSECLSCGNVKAEQPLRIIESRMVDPFGNSVRRRKISPEDWYQRYKEKVEPRVIDFMKLNPSKKEKIPEALFKTPTWFKQLKIFIKRDYATKRANRQYLAIALLQAPVLAVLLGFFAKFSSTEIYLFRYNDNIPAFLFMSVVVALFIGLTISAEEIFKDRRIRKREEFLNLSKGAYFVSKILILFTISALQVLTFVLIGNWLLEIKGMTFTSWAILFSTACFANLLGLNLSSGLNSIVTIYIMIPLMLVPQLLLSGVIIDFNKMHHSLSSYDRTPVIGDVMTSRWAYEALAVNQFKNNNYRAEFFQEEVTKNDLNFKAYHFIPELKKYLHSYYFYLNEGDTIQAALVKPLIINSFDKITHAENDSIGWAVSKLGDKNATHRTKPILTGFLNNASDKYQEQYQAANKALEDKYKTLLDKFDGNKDKLNDLKNENTNAKLETIIRNRYSSKKLHLTGNQILQADEPIYRKPAYKNGSAHFYASYKYLGDLKINTVLFNIAIIWLFTFLLMISLYYDLLRKGITYVENWRKLRQSILRDRIFYHPMEFIKGNQEKKESRKI